MTAEDRITAAELAIGLLGDEERSWAQARADEEPAFAREVEWWQQNLALLLAHIGDVPPPSYLRERIAARIEVPAIGEKRITHRWRLIGTGGAIGALAASLVAWLLVPTERTPVPAPPVIVTRPTPIFVASLTWATQSAKPAPVAVFEPTGGTLRLSSTVDLPTGRVGQLWRISGKAKPISLGLLPSRTDPRLMLARDNVPVAGDTLAISVEPAGGSPTGQPTGPVILSGTLAAV